MNARKAALEEALQIPEAIKFSCEALVRRGTGDRAYAMAGIEWSEEIARHIRELIAKESA